MTALPIRAVYDCVVFLQGAGRRGNASRKCLELVDAGTVQLCLSAPILAEIDDVLHRPELLRKFPLLTSRDSQNLLLAARNLAFVPADTPHIFSLPRDPDDEIYIDLAVAADARFIVTWNDRHLTYLMRQDTPEGVNFCAKFPNLAIVDPPTFLNHVALAITPKGQQQH